MHDGRRTDNLRPGNPKWGLVLIQNVRLIKALTKKGYELN